MLRPEARYDPRTPKGARNATIVGTPVFVPIIPARARSTVPSVVPIMMTAVACWVPRPGTSSVPATITRRLTARSPHRTAKSKARRARRSMGTGWTPQSSGALTLSFSAIAAIAPPGKKTAASPSQRQSHSRLPPLALPRSGSAVAPTGRGLSARRSRLAAGLPSSRYLVHPQPSIGAI